MRSIDKFHGCLIGGAAGDALGYSVEFLSYDDIISHYKMDGITEYNLHGDVAEISDDTQMTLFTANGLLLGKTRLMTRGFMGSYQSYIAYCYKDWYKTQTEAFRECEEDDYCYSWLMNLPEMFCKRAPGNTCLSAISSGENGSVDEPINDSKGCGGIMRVAPIGLYFIDSTIPQNDIDMLGAETAALTHGHELGYIPAAMLVHIVSLLADGKTDVKGAVLGAMKAMYMLFQNSKHIGELQVLIDKAVALSESDISDINAISQLGEGWVAEETLAIAVYCALKYPDDFEKAIIASVNHNGDSDSTGAVTGNILGAYLGYDKIPKKFSEKLELKDVILELADDLYKDCKMEKYSSYRDEIWTKKYIDNTYDMNKIMED